MTIYPRVYAKLSETHFNVSLFYNCVEKVLKSRREMGQIWDRFSGSSSRNWRTSIHWNVVLTILNKPWDMWSLLTNFELHFNVSLFSNRGEKVLKSIKTWWTQDLRVQHRVNSTDSGVNYILHWTALNSSDLVHYTVLYSTSLLLYWTVVQ